MRRRYVVVEAIGIGNVDQFVSFDGCIVAFLISKQRSWLILALDHIVDDSNRRKVAVTIESEQALPSRCLGCSRDNVIVANL